MNGPWEHLLPLVSALERGGNAPIPPGFVPVTGGYECAMRDPLDFELLRPVRPTDKDVHLAESSDLVWCSHCWTTVIGARRIAEVAEG
jgi:hypothetical protein